MIDDAKAPGATEVNAEDAFRLHDTYGFPFEVTRELLAEEGLEVSAAGFETLMAEQRDRARQSNGRTDAAMGEGALEFVRERAADGVRRLRASQRGDQRRGGRRRAREARGESRSIRRAAARSPTRASSLGGRRGRGRGRDPRGR